jgi:hypothetical protein
MLVVFKVVNPLSFQLEGVLAVADKNSSKIYLLVENNAQDYRVQGSQVHLYTFLVDYQNNNLIQISQNITIDAYAKQV